MVTLVRLKHEKEQTLGYLFNGLELIACTLELEWNDNKRRVSCIPTGIYKVVKRYSQKYKNHFHVTNVENRSWILIHQGNFNRQILGCILVGDKHIDIDKDGYKDVTNSVKTMAKLNKILPSEFDLLVK